MTGLLVWLSLSTASATELVAGAGSVLNDPFLNQTTLLVGASHPVVGIVRLAPVFGYTPDLGEGDWSRLTTQLVNENNISPDISKTQWFGALRMEVPIVRTRSSHTGASGATRIVDAELRLVGGLGMVRTRDDLEALQAVGDERATATEFQTHRSTHYGLSQAVYLKETVGLRLDLERMNYIETVNSTVLEFKGLLQCNLQVVFALGDSTRSGASSQSRGAK